MTPERIAELRRAVIPGAETEMLDEIERLQAELAVERSLLKLAREELDICKDELVDARW